MTGEVIRASRQSALRYERQRPGPSLVHVDVKKLGRIPPGGGWRANGRGDHAPDPNGGSVTTTVHSMVDDPFPLRLLRGPR